MKIFAETERLILREIVPSDLDGMFELDSDPEVHQYLGNKTVSDKNQIAQTINFVRQQYTDRGIGRWAIIDKIEETYNSKTKKFEATNTAYSFGDFIPV
jgi:ribosomal-protein-alanine N-acetyltransferase